jgi:hypothetical protein
MLTARQKSDPIPINQRVRGIKVPEDVASLIGTCLARDIARRPPDGADLLTRLRKCAHRLEDGASDAPTRLLVVGEELDGASSRLKAGSDRGQLSTVAFSPAGRSWTTFLLLGLGVLFLLGAVAGFVVASRSPGH